LEAAEVDRERFSHEKGTIGPDGDAGVELVDDPAFVGAGDARRKRDQQRQ